MARGERTRIAKDAVVLAIGLLMIGAVYTSVLIVERQSALAAVSRYNLTWLVSQAGLEVSRLYGTVAASLVPGSGVEEDEVDLRLSIVENRIQVLESGDMADFTATSPDLTDIVEQFRTTIRDARTELEAPADSGHPLRMMRLVGTLGTPIARLAAAANAYSSNMEAADRDELNSLHWLFAAILACITACGLASLGATSWHNRMLARAREGMMRHNLALKQRDHELQIRNHQFDAALNNMSQALCMVDGQERLIVCNVRFVELFGLQAAQVAPGVMLRDLFPARLARTPFQKVMAGMIARQERGAGQQAASFTEQDEAGHALAISQEPMEDGGWVTTFEDVTERRRNEARIRHMAHHDALTGLGNRAGFQAGLEQAAAEPGQGCILAVMCIDLDRFKQVNDMYGHPVGDELLCLVSARLRACIRQEDTVARLGGDEFAVLQAGVGQPGAAQAAARRIVEVLGQPFEVKGHQVTVGASVGIALSDGTTVSPTKLLNSADIALYRAKSDGKNTFRFYEAAMGQELRARQELEVDLREAMERGEFEVFYQPLYDLASDRVCGFEALLRWCHPEKGMVSPTVFIPIAEETGLIVGLGEWVLRRACMDAAAWPAPLKVAVNLSSVQFRVPDLVACVKGALLHAGLPAARLELEITESVLLDSDASVLTTLRELRALGVDLSLDDFGTGYSSLGYLHSFPFSKVKIDRSFVQDVVERPDCEAIVRAVTALATSMGMTTIAEGVETRAQLDTLRKLGCTEVQGFLFDKPRPLSQLGRWFEPDRSRSPRESEALILT